MTPVTLRQLGDYDATSEIAVGADGRFTAEHGGYVTAGRRTGRLSRRDLAHLGRLTEAVDLGATHPAQGAVVITLSVGDQSVAWAGAPPTDPLAALVNALVRLTA